MCIALYVPDSANDKSKYSLFITLVYACAHMRNNINARSLLCIVSKI